MKVLSNQKVFSIQKMSSIQKMFSIQKVFRIQKCLVFKKCLVFTFFHIVQKQYGKRWKIVKLVALSEIHAFWFATYVVSLQN